MWREQFNQIEAAETVEKSFEKIPEGTYLAMVTGAMINESKIDSPRVELEFSICEGDFAKRKVWKNYNLNEKGIPFLKADLAKMGQNPSTPEALEQSLGDINGAILDVFIKYKTVKNALTGQDKEYSQVYINGMQESLPF